MDFGKIFMQHGILLGHFLCDRVQGVERFAAHPRHFPSQVPPPRVNISLLVAKMSSRKDFQQSDWLTELSPGKNVKPRIRSTFHGSTIIRLVEMQL